MQQNNTVLNEINLIKSFKSLAIAYEEISAIKMQRTRSLVLNNRDFLSEVYDVFYDVKSSYKKQIDILLRHSKGKKTISSPLLKNGKSVAVLLSSNSKLYGDIVNKVMNLFMDYIKNTDTDIVIIGKLGKDFMENSGLHREYTYFELSDSAIQMEELKPLISKIFEYEKVTVFYGKFVNLFNQNAVVSDISGETPYDDKQKDSKTPFAFIFEPDLEKILLFFQTQIITSLFKQSVHETQLARHASRIKAMDLTIERINNRITMLDTVEKRMKRSQINKKQLETISGISLWKR